MEVEKVRVINRSIYTPLVKTLWSNMSKPSKNVMRLPLEKRAEIAFTIAVAKAIDEHVRLGLPIYIWRNGKVVELSPKKARSSLKLNRKR